MRLSQQLGNKRETKGKDKSRYQELKAEIQRKLKVDKQQQLEGVCMVLEAANSKGNCRQLFQIVKSMTRKFQPRLQCIQSMTGANLTEATQIADGWKGYCENLHHDEGKGIEQKYWEQKPPSLRSEITRAIRQTANRKATGPDEVPAELFKAGRETALNRMHRICVAIWETGEWPEEWTSSTFIPLPKKGDLKQCANYRTIALVSHASKILLRIILERINIKTETELQTNRRDSDKEGGLKNKPWISEYWCRRYQQPLYMCFMDFK